jgi:hypothetical protein
MSAIVRSKGVMPSPQCERSAFLLLCGLILAQANALYAQGVAREGVEFSLSGTRKGDQTVPQLAIGPAGGYVVWQDNGIDGPGNSFGIAARKLGPDLVPPAKSFRVNSILKGPQENPQVTLLNDGGAAFVWQGGRLGGQDIFFRRVTAAGTFTPKSNDVRVSTFERGDQTTPVITCLSNGNLAIAWCSLHQDKSLGGIYARILTRKGQFVTNPFRVNEFRSNNQRNPAITTLSNGNFVVAWVSENQGVSMMEALQNHTNRVHVYARVFGQDGLPVMTEFRVNTRSNLCSSPAVAPSADQGFTVVWAEKADNRDDNWDICARTFSAGAQPATATVLVNSTTYGDQFSPRVAQVGSQQMVVWNTLGHDGSREGIFGRLLSQGTVNGPEFLVNTRTGGSQIYPVVVSDGNSTFLAAWSSHLELSSFDVHAQRYSVIGDDSGSEPGVSLVDESPNLNPGAGPPPPPTGFVITVSEVSPQEALRVSIAKTSKGKLLRWNTEVGRSYQVQYSTNFSRWDNLGEPRPAAATSDSMVVGNGENAAFYRVIRLQ